MAHGNHALHVAAMVETHGQEGLLERVRNLYALRDDLKDKQDRLSHSMPEWALMPLRLAGLSQAEIDRIVDEQAELERSCGLPEITRQLESVEAEIDEFEDSMLAAPMLGRDGLPAVLELALGRLRERTVTEEASPFYDHGDARLLSLLERASAQLSGPTGYLERRAS
jgi:hypothetical protein